MLLRLDQALGQAVELLEPLAPASPLEHALAFDGPTTQLEAIQAAVRELLAALHQSLQTREEGARALALTVERALLPAIVIPLSLSKPSRDPKHLWSLLAPHLETLHLGHGVEGVHLAVRDSARIAHRQLHCDTSIHDPFASADDGRLGRLLDTLSAMLGRARVTRLTARQTHVPEDRFRLEPIAEAPPLLLEAFADEVVQRPSLLFEKALPLRVEVDAMGRPMRVRLPDGPAALMVEACEGPECVGSRWWETPLPPAPDDEAEAALLTKACQALRLYYRLRLQVGPILWVYKQHPRGGWFLQGYWS